MKRATVILALRQYPQGGGTRRSVIADLIRNPEGQGSGGNKTTPTIYPLSLDGRGIKEPVPVPDTGIRG